MTYQVGPAEVPGGDRVFGVKENVDITKYAAVVQSAGVDCEVDMPGGAGVEALGIAQEAVDYSEGQHHVSVRTAGFSKAIAYDGSIAAGDHLAIADTEGRLTTAVSTNHIVARATEASAAKDDIIVVQVLCGICHEPAPRG